MDSCHTVAEATPWKATEVRFNNFEDLPMIRGVSVKSPEFTHFGHQWCLQIYTGGTGNGGIPEQNNTHSKEGMIGVFLHNMSEESIEVEFGCSVKGSGNSEKANCAGEIYERMFTPKDGSCNNWGFHNFAKHSGIMNALVAGTLIIDVRMRCTDRSLPFIAGNPLCNMMLKMFMNKESSDVVFEVEDGDGDQHVRKAQKRTKTIPATFYAHRLILKQCAPMLAALCGSGEGGLTSIPITGIKPEIFRHMLYYVYGGKVGEEDLKSHAKKLIEAANRFGVVNLKLEAEVYYVRSIIIGVDNVMELLLYSHAMNLALLKEAVMDFIVENRVEVLEKVPLKDAPGGLLADLLTATTRGMEKDSDGVGGDEFIIMRISDLRKKLHEKGLDIDGSRETLIAALKENEVVS